MLARPRCAFWEWEENETVTPSDTETPQVFLDQNFVSRWTAFLRSKILELTDDAVGLSKSVTETCTEAEVVVKKVRELDLVTSRTRASMKRVEDIVGLKTCIEEVDKAVKSEQYEAAANALQRYLGVAPEDAQTEEVHSAPSVFSGAHSKPTALFGICIAVLAIP